MAALDPTNADGRILPCTRCQKPVVSSTWSGHVKLRCGYCNFEDERELVLAESSTEEARDPYRDPAKPKERAELPINLNLVLPGHSMNAITWEKLRTSFERRPLLEEHLASIEWERVWLGIWLAMQQSMRGDYLDARMALEATLEATRTPAYRALILAQLAQHAAARGAVPLAKKWLRARPDVAVAEVDGEIAAARAFVLLAQGRFDEAIEKTGGRLAGGGFRGFSAFLANAINVEARERKGDKRTAQQLLGAMRANKSLVSIHLLMAAHGIGSVAMERFAKKERIRVSARAGILPAFVIFAVGLGVGLGLRKTLVSAAIALVMGSVSEWVVWKIQLPALPRIAQVLRAVIPFVLVVGGVYAFIDWDRHAHPLSPPAPTKPEEEPNAAMEALMRGMDVQNHTSAAERALDGQHWEEAKSEAAQCLRIDPSNAACTSLLARATESQSQSH